MGPVVELLGKRRGQMSDMQGLGSVGQTSKLTCGQIRALISKIVDVQVGGDLFYQVQDPYTRLTWSEKLSPHSL